MRILKMAKQTNIVAQLRQDRKILWIALACGLLAAFFLFLYLKSADRKYGELEPVLVVDVNLNKGDPITERAIKIVELPSKFIPGNRIKIEDRALIIGEATSIPILEGEVLLWSHIHTEKRPYSLSETLDKTFNERAVTISVDEIKAVGGHIRVNDRVDVIGTFTVPARKKNNAPVMKTKTLLQCVTVLAVGSPITSQQQAQGFAGTVNSVTLKTSPEEAALLIFAESVGQLRLVLRNPEDLPSKDQDEAQIPEIDFNNIFKFPTVSKDRIRITYGIGKEKN
jgi:pilus assembly protein CpaB